MKKIIFVFVMIVGISFTACSSENSGQGNQQSDNTQGNSTQSQDQSNEQFGHLIYEVTGYQSKEEDNDNDDSGNENEITYNLEGNAGEIKLESDNNIPHAYNSPEDYLVSENKNELNEALGDSDEDFEIVEEVPWSNSNLKGFKSITRAIDGLDEEKQIKIAIFEDGTSYTLTLETDGDNGKAEEIFNHFLKSVNVAN